MPNPETFVCSKGIAYEPYMISRHNCEVAVVAERAGSLAKQFLPKFFNGFISSGVRKRNAAYGSVPIIGY